MLQKKLNLFSISKILNTIVLQKTRYYMTLDYYRIFFYVARYKSFSKAAEALNNNQPNITRYMNILESELGCKLLIRSHKGVKLTPEGNSFMTMWLLRWLSSLQAKTNLYETKVSKRVWFQSVSAKLH